MSLRTTLTQKTGLSCGVRLLGQLDSGKAHFPSLAPKENAERVVRLVARNRIGNNWSSENFYAQVVFSHREDDPYCEALLDLIRSERLGTITKSPAVENPNSGSIIRTYIWTLNKKRLEKWNVKEPYKPRAKRSTWRRDTYFTTDYEF